jgi:hypothetical protein
MNTPKAFIAVGKFKLININKVKYAPIRVKTYELARAARARGIAL